MYKPNQPPEQYFEEIEGLAYKIVDDVFWSMHNMENNIAESEIKKLLPNIRQQVIFEIYYIVYIICADRNSIYYYHKEFIDNNTETGTKTENTERWRLFTELLDKYKYTNFKDDKNYNRFQRTYRHYRQNADIMAQGYYNVKNIGLYDNIVQKYTSHKLTRLDWLFIKRTMDDEDIGFLFDVLRDQRLPNNKKVSNSDFINRIVSGINKMYESIENTDYKYSDNPYTGTLLRTIDYYQFEKNCSIELSYMASYALSQIRKTLEEKEFDRRMFHDLRWCELVISYKSHMIQNKAIAMISAIFDKYIDNEIDANTVRCIYACINSIIYLSMTFVLKCYFGGSFMKNVTDDYWIDIFQRDENIKKELKIKNLDDFMCQETQMFFNSYIGRGQHIIQKQWNSIKVKDFREMYTPIIIHSEQQI